MRTMIPVRGKINAGDAGRRRRPLSPWRVAIRTILIAPWVLLGLAAATVAFAIWSEGGPESFSARVKSEFMLASLRMGFGIEEVWVNGLKRSDRKAVLAATGAIRGEPILEFDAGAARERLLALPWIKDAVVAKSLPRQIHVGLTERSPLALWQVERKLVVIDEDGDVIPGVRPKDYPDLPILVGEGADREASQLIALIATAPTIARRMTAAVFVAERRWNLRIDDRIDVRLPAGEPAAALARLSKLEASEAVFTKDIVAIDLRLDDRLIVRLAPDAELPEPPRPPKRAGRQS